MSKRIITDHYADDGTSELTVGSVILSHGEALLAQVDGTFADPNGSTWDYWELELPITVIHEADAGKTLDASHSNPRKLTTVAELDALPFGSVILDRSGLSLHKNEFIGWRASNGAKDISPEMLEQEAFPATVLYEPVQ